jgi:hypothetical protein
VLVRTKHPDRRKQGIGVANPNPKCFEGSRPYSESPSGFDDWRPDSYSRVVSANRNTRRKPRRSVNQPFAPELLELEDLCGRRTAPGSMELTTNGGTIPITLECPLSSAERSTQRSGMRSDCGTSSQYNLLSITPCFTC